MTGRRWGAKVSKMVLLCLKCFFLPHPVAQKRAAHLSGMDLMFLSTALPACYHSRRLGRHCHHSSYLDWNEQIIELLCIGKAGSYLSIFLCLTTLLTDLSTLPASVTSSLLYVDTHCLLLGLRQNHKDWNRNGVGPDLFSTVLTARYLSCSTRNYLGCMGWFGLHNLES